LFHFAIVAGQSKARLEFLLICYIITLLFSRPEQAVVNQLRNALDKVGIAMTSLCAIHCIMLPVLLPVLPLFGLTAWHNHALERGILLASMVLGFVTIFAGFHRYHKKLHPFYSLFLGGFIYWNKDVFGVEYEHAILIIGAAFVVLAHVLNLRLCNHCHSCESH